MLVAGALAATGACSTDPRNASAGAGGAHTALPPTDASAESGVLIDRRTVLASLADNAIARTLDEFSSRADDLAAATAQYEQSQTDLARDHAREAWRGAMATWQRAEMMQLGPAGDMTATPGGADLRAAIYSWPVVNSCFVDQETVTGAYVDESAFATVTVNRIGLDAMEYLLFAASTSNTCAPQATINTSGDWAALGDAEVAARRAAYAAVAGRLVVEAARELRDAWAPNGGDFRHELVWAGSGGTVYASQKEAYDALYTALLYLDTATKDAKLGLPAGLAPECTTPVCPDRLESRHALASKAHVRGNLQGFQWMFHGGPPEDERLGLDDLLRVVGAADLARAMTEAIEAALATVDAIEEPTLDEALEKDRESVVALHAAVQALTTLLKSQLAVTLDLEALGGQAADND